MSHYETPEQRQIRKLRERINTMTNQASQQASQNSELRRELYNVRQQQQSENERLLQQIRQQQNSSQRERTQMSEAIRKLDEQVKERERLQRERIQAMHSEHEAQIHRLETEFQNEKQGLRDEIRQTRSELRQSISQLRSETDQKLRKQREETQRNLSQMNAKLEAQISDVDRKVNTIVQQIAAKEQGDRELAEYWVQEAARMMHQIRESFREQLLDIRRVSLIERKICQAIDDVKGGQYQSAITTGREAFFGALDMKEDLAVAELEWNYWFNALKTREAELLQALDSAKNRIYEIDTEEGPIEYSNGIDYWTFGQLTIVRNQINELHESLKKPDTMSLAELQSAEEKLRSLQEQLTLVENAAHINVAMSVSRYETALKIGRILDSSFEMNESDGEFFGREDREEYHAIFQNPMTEDQIAVVITPIPDETGVVTNHIELIVGNVNNDPITRERIALEVAEKLRSSGLEGCSFPCARRFGDETAQEVARVGDIEAVELGDEKSRATLPEGTRRTESLGLKVKRRTLSEQKRG